MRILLAFWFAAHLHGVHGLVVPTSTARSSGAISGTFTTSSRGIHSGSLQVRPLLATIDNNHSNDDDDDLATIQALGDLASKVGTLTKQLAATQRQLKRSRFSWMQEKSVLIRKISALTELVRQQQQQRAAMPAVETVEEHKPDNDKEERDRELLLYQENQEELVNENDRLEREVNLLQGEIVKIHNMLRVEQRKNQELSIRLEEVEDALEFEQTEKLVQRTEMQEDLESQLEELRRLRKELAQFQDSSHGRQQQPTKKNGKHQHSNNKAKVM